MNIPVRWMQGVSLGEKICFELRFQIIKGIIPIGTVLSENQIAADFGTSRSPVREAFRVLANEGLIRLERMGAAVLGLTTKDIEELYDVRYLLEGFAMQRIATHFDKSQIVLLEQLIEKMELTAKHEDYMEFSYYDIQFHDTIIKAAEHSRILHLWKSIRQILLTFLLVATEKRFTENKEEIQSLLNNHRILVEALRTGDPYRLQETLDNHSKDNWRTVTAAYFKS
ncbi:GntR family transcriptional regulator [Ammoniphilus resinae]|uniref:GntR family transcriptional regulator of gluconate operon n=1 Tax=Ammoniphilus resinae TaxID=861532 RepID=A0ABS4GND2_9BACL|nr:GntR family transcriptional regulator [Ammoniphilus resinae]MBP1931749.1 GntR family transcriptional regulator of gluconate operon [Ammoniphilus resinae]